MLHCKIKLMLLAILIQLFYYVRTSCNRMVKSVNHTSNMCCANTVGM